MLLARYLELLGPGVRVETVDLESRDEWPSVEVCVLMLGLTLVDGVAVEGRARGAEGLG